MNAVSRARVYPELGRVSNLPTIATQTAAAVAVAGAFGDPLDFGLVGIALASAYVAGMFLNDAFDREIDARERPDRPIPSGRITVREVFVAGGALLLAGVVLLTIVGLRRGHLLAGAGGAAALAGAIVLYDAWHKGNPVGPMLMGACRGLVYVAVGLAVTGTVPTLSMLGALAMFAYVVGLSEVAKRGRANAKAAAALVAAPVLLGLGCRERPLALLAVVALGAVIVHALRTARTPGAGDRATVVLLAGMSLVDAALLGAAGHLVLATVAALAVTSTKALQRFVRGT